MAQIFVGVDGDAGDVINNFGTAFPTIRPRL